MIGKFIWLILVPMVLTLIGYRLLRTLFKEGYKEIEYLQMPIILHLIIIISAFIPIMSWVSSIILLIVIFILYADCDYQSNHWLFKLK